MAKDDIHENPAEELDENGWPIGFLKQLQGVFQTFRNVNLKAITNNA